MERIYLVKELRTILLLTLLYLALGVLAQGQELTSIPSERYDVIEIHADTLPSLNVSRAGHDALLLDGQMTVFGGHSDGFVLAPSAEYFRDGQWHTVPLVYPHDHAVVMPLRSGKVFLAGGHQQPLGIGQTFSAEIYDPETNTSTGFGCMDRKRAFLNALEMKDGQVVICGNWFDKDGIGMFEDIYDPRLTNAIDLKNVSYGRAKPYILRVSDDNAIIFSSLSEKNEPVDYALIDQLEGESYKEPFLNTWTPIRTIEVQRSYNQFIGNQEEGLYEWLLPVENDSTGQVAIARVQGITPNNSKPVFSLVQLEHPLPYFYQGDRIFYNSLVCDRDRELAFLVGNTENARMFVAAFPYNSAQPSALTIYVTDEPQPILTQSVNPMLTPEGDLVFAGGRLINNFEVSKSVIRLPLGKFYGATNLETDSYDSNDVNCGGKLCWLWIFLICLGAIGLVALFIFKRKKKTTADIHSASTRPNAISNSTVLTNDIEDEKSNIEEESSIGKEASQQIPAQGSSESIDKDADVISIEKEEDIFSDKNMSQNDVLSQMYKRIEQLMEEEQLYLNPNLRAADIAVRLSTNIGYVSSAINSQCRCSFTQYLTRYRIAYAQRLMRQKPESKLISISALSGFSTESTFFRAFRSITGMSPKEWLSENNGQ